MIRRDGTRYLRLREWSRETIRRRKSRVARSRGCVIACVGSGRGVGLAIVRLLGRWEQRFHRPLRFLDIVVPENSLKRITDTMKVAILIQYNNSASVCINMEEKSTIKAINYH